MLTGSERQSVSYSVTKAEAFQRRFLRRIYIEIFSAASLQPQRTVTTGDSRSVTQAVQPKFGLSLRSRLTIGKVARLAEKIYNADLLSGSSESELQTLNSFELLNCPKFELKGYKLAVSWTQPTIRLQRASRA